jgi:hypothetical protein
MKINFAFMSIKSYGFEDDNTKLFVLSTGSNRANVPKLLCCTSISRVVSSGCHVDMKVMKNNSAFSMCLVLFE